jgi:Domain of unknown function (DUF2017)
MAGYFERDTASGGQGGAPGAVIALDEVEISILRSLAVQFLELVGPGREQPTSADVLESLLADGPTKPPQDPALARLFPDGYADDTGAAAEFRRFTENDLRDRKREDALAVVRTLDTGGPVLKLTPEESRRWLGTLNDLRLTIGTRLEVTEDDSEMYQLPDSDPRKPMMMAYLWLGGLQESLVETLLP